MEITQKTSQKCELTDGPTLFDLIVGLFDEDQGDGSRRQVVFQTNSPGLDPRFSAEIWGVERWDMFHTWTIVGKTRQRDSRGQRQKLRFNGFYNSDTRKGDMTIFDVD